MKSVFLLFALLPLLPSYALDLDSCLEREMIKKDELVREVKDNLVRELQSCLRYPLEEKYYQCEYRAKLRFEKEIEKTNSIFKLRRKACLKFPFLN
ncbi:MAG: hypothetical protein OEY33_01030 [Bdellovibrionales bacterium]|nr:hypothetical protein [Bdellovibrionales bacterium]